LEGRLELNLSVAALRLPGATLAPGPGLPCQRRSLKAARITSLKISGCCLRIRYQSGPATG